MKPAEESFDAPLPKPEEQRWNPHARPPILVTGAGVVKVADPWAAVSVRDLLAEPPMLEAKGEWLSAVYARLLAVSSGCIATTLGQTSADDQALFDRLEKAGVFRAAPGVDLMGVRAKMWPDLHGLRFLHWGIGTPRPRIVCVGECAPRDQIPFFTQSGAWMFGALRHLGYDEFSIYVTNAYSVKGYPQPEKLLRLQELLSVNQPRWIAVGEMAHRALANANIEHGHVEHPQHVLRFHTHRKYEGYAESWTKQGVEPGPWHGASLPLVPARERAAMPPSLDMPRTLTVVNRATSRSEIRLLSGVEVSSAKLERAKSAYITGMDRETGRPTKSLAEVARVTGVNQQRIYSLSALQDWKGLREAHLAQRAEESAKAAIKHEAELVARGVQLSGQGAIGMLNVLSILVGREWKKLKEDPEAEVDLSFMTPAGVKALTETWDMLGRKNDVQGAEASAKFKSMSPLDQAAEMAAALAAQFGMEAVLDAIKVKMAAKPNPEAAEATQPPVTDAPSAPVTPPPPPDEPPPLDLAPDPAPTPPV